MLDFVILYHELPVGLPRVSHWDLMLRDGDRLLTWALDADPLTESQAMGQRLPDHRLEYLQFEGPISGNRGSVTRIASGTFRWLNARSASAWQVELSPDSMESDEKILIGCHDDKAFEISRL